MRRVSAKPDCQRSDTRNVRSGSFSAFGPLCQMSGLLAIADIGRTSRNGRKVPTRDIGVTDNTSHPEPIRRHTSLLAKPGASVGDATVAAPTGATHARREIRCCRGPLSTDGHSM
jgi:hypothetical protein